MASTVSDHRMLRALRREPVDKTPVWIMRQAGRYLPEYRATRARAGSFLALAKTPELACEVTLQPLARFPLDAAILFSDILTIPDAMGLGLHFVEGEGPKFRRPLRSASEIARIGVPDMESELRYVMDAVRLIRRELADRVPLIGFAGSPWTLACYMIEGSGSSSFARAKALALDDPASMHRLLDTLAHSVAEYLSAQIAAGAQIVMVFDTWGGLLAPAQFREFSLQSLHQIAALLKSSETTRDIPLILFSKGANGHLEGLADSGCDALGLDWTIALGDARERVGTRVALQGNLDPAVLHARPEVIRRQVEQTLNSFGSHPGHVFNLGHGVTPDIDPDRVAVLVDAVHELSARPVPRS
ncbi:MAG: uroporphyrinogen decarboxylase [Rhodanobacteraceae bacterium]